MPARQAGVSLNRSGGSITSPAVFLSTERFSRKKLIILIAPFWPTFFNQFRSSHSLATAVAGREMISPAA
jgi:hypothetical protein